MWNEVTEFAIALHALPHSRIAVSASEHNWILSVDAWSNLSIPDMSPLGKC